MKIVDYYDFLKDKASDFFPVGRMIHDYVQDVNEWVILQNLPNESLGEGNDWIDRALIYIESVEWGNQGKPQINMEGYEFVNLLEHFEYGTPIDGGEELLKRMSRALERGDLHYELSQGQLGIDLNNVVVANEIEIDWNTLDYASYIWNNDGWRIKRLNDPRMLPFMCSINYRLIL